MVRRKKKKLSQAVSSITRSRRIAQSVYGEFGNIYLFYVQDI